MSDIQITRIGLLAPREEEARPYAERTLATIRRFRAGDLSELRLTIEVQGIFGHTGDWPVIVEMHREWRDGRKGRIGFDMQDEFALRRTFVDLYVGPA